MRLYELEQEYLELLAMAEDEDTPADVLADTLEAVGGEIEVKADGYAKVIRELENDIEGLKVEIDRMTKLKKAIENNKTRVASALQKAMIATDKRKFKTDLFSFSIAKNPPSLKIAKDLDINTLPPDFIKWSEPTVDKDAVKKALKDGQELEWATLEQGESLRIK